MDLSSGQFPHEPCLHGSEQQLPALCAFPCIGNIFQDPAKFRARKISVEYKSGLFAEPAHQSLGFQIVAVLRGPAALPHDGGTDRFSVLLIPYDGRLTLVRDADRRDILRGRPNGLHRFDRNGQLRCPDLVCVVLNPSGMRIILLKLALCH